MTLTAAEWSGDKHLTQRGPVRLSPLGFRNLNQEPQRPRGLGLRPGLASGACVWLPVAALLCCSSAFASYPSLLPAIAPCSPHRFAYVNPEPFLLLAIKILLTHFWLPKKDQRKVSICVYYSCFSIHYRSCNFTSRIRLSPPLPIFHSPQYVSCCYRPTKRGSEKSSKLSEEIFVLVGLFRFYRYLHMYTYMCVCMCIYIICIYIYIIHI